MVHELLLEIETDANQDEENQNGFTNSVRRAGRLEQ
jgi:hypothetical protein